MTTVLFTGFEPFGGGKTNPSWKAAQLAAAAWQGPGAAAAELLPVTFNGLPRALAKVLRSHNPKVVVAAGLGPVAGVCLERVAINLIDARIQDNDGVQPVDEPVLTGAQTAYFATLPIKVCLQALQEAGLPGQVSLSAGAYVCNQTLYLLGDWVANGAKAQVGFVHLPRPGRIKGGSLSYEDLGRALCIVAAATLEAAPQLLV